MKIKPSAASSPTTSIVTNTGIFTMAPFLPKKQCHFETRNVGSFNPRFGKNKNRLAGNTMLARLV